VELAKEPRTILDVGAANGTPQLYGAYPDALIVAFEPLAEQLERLRLTLKGRPSELVPVAIGDSTDEVRLSIDTTNALKSSLYSRTMLTRDSKPSTERTVPMRRLDDLVSESGWEPPYVLKVDTEGHELAVLSGATATLRDACVIYCEVSVGPRFNGSYRFSEVAALLIQERFELVDVLDAPRGPDGRTLLIDSVWMPTHDGTTSEAP
jgi:FkbM family methyltransferase